jgi:hypothetical protein
LLELNTILEQFCGDRIRHYAKLAANLTKPAGKPIAYSTGMTNDNDAANDTGLVDYLLDAITYGQRFDATTNERTGAYSIADAYPESRDWTRQQVREAYANWTKSHDA